MAALKDILEGKPLGSPVHPVLVHIPIALLPLASILDLINRALDAPPDNLPRAAFVCLVAGIAGALVAAIFGFVDYTEIRDDHPAKKTATLHMILNLGAVGLYALSAGLRYGALDEPRVATAPLAVALVALGIVSFSGYLGGRLVYDDGVAVGRHRRKTRLPEKTIAVRPKTGPVAVGDEGSLREGETLRVSIDGTVATVVRLKDGIYAFQEFCTHRYGPLSEGSFQGCEVVCPWHRSCFDVRTGEVKHGPAKVPLRTFRTELRDGKIWVYAEGK